MIRYHIRFQTIIQFTVISGVLRTKSFYMIYSCGELKSFMLDWGGVLQEIEIDTENFDLHRSIPVDKDVSFIGCYW